MKSKSVSIDRDTRKNCMKCDLLQIRFQVKVPFELING